MYVAGPFVGGVVSGLAYHAHLGCFERLSIAGKKEIEREASLPLNAND